MPNWCENTFTIEGPSILVQSFVDNLQESENSDHLMLTSAWPMPEVLRGTRSPAPSGEFDPEGNLMGYVLDPENTYWTDEHYADEKANHYALIEQAERAKAETGYDNWYDWASDNWGTKWDVEVLATGVDHGATSTVTLWGDSAWSPPISLLANLSEKYPQLTFSVSYFEPGMDYIGAAVFQDGRMAESEASFSEHLPWDAYSQSEDGFEAMLEDGTVYDVRDNQLAMHLAHAEAMLRNEELVTGHR